MIYEPIKVDKLVSQISAVSDNIEDISEEVQNMTDVIGEVEDTIKERFYFRAYFETQTNLNELILKIFIFSKSAYFGSQAKHKTEQRNQFQKKL